MRIKNNSLALVKLSEVYFVQENVYNIPSQNILNAEILSLLHIRVQTDDFGGEAGACCTEYRVEGCCVFLPSKVRPPWFQPAT